MTPLTIQKESYYGSILPKNVSKRSARKEEVAEVDSQLSSIETLNYNEFELVGMKKNYS